MKALDALKQCINKLDNMSKEEFDNTQQNMIKDLYSDRLYQWNSNKFNDICSEIWGDCSQYFYDRNINDIERFLCRYLNKNIRLIAVIEYLDKSTGCPYWRFRYFEITE